MTLQNLRWPAIVVAVLVTLGALFGGGYVLRSQTVEEPLKAALSGAEGVESATVERDNSRRVVTARLTADADLQRAYTTLDGAVSRVLKDAPYSIRLEDRRDAHLEETHRRMNLFVQEAITTGQFSDMAEKVEAEAARAGARAVLAVDADRVYLELHRENSYLYSVTERPKPVYMLAPRASEGGFGL